ncbi:hypothetical protein R4227_08925 [Gordonia amicalis]|uniref:hypothetical protein n=1 Tax=Gordonia amicalis TaxID=89053 RepID=UPI002952DEEA|nr:hypothetical protein [Gordonia amicalis]MDV7100251.1 hypothetical protein [Gordonia amicalis]
MSSRLRALLTCGILLTTGAIGTTALWSTTAATTSGTFTTANLEIKANGSVAHTFAFPGALLPGNTTAYVVNVQNTGSVQFHYDAKVSSSTALGQAMRLRVVVDGTVSGTTCTSGTQIATNLAITGSPVAFATNRGPLAATTGTEALCMQLTLPSTAAGSLAGTSGSVTFTFDATGP